MTTILILGDFSGRASRGEHEPASVKNRRRYLVDRDDLEERLAQLGVEVRLQSGELLTIRELEDLEPDRIVDRLPSFAELRALRVRLQDPKTFQQAAAELTASASGPVDAALAEVRVAEEAPPGIAIPDDLLSAAMEATVRRAQPSGLKDGRAFAQDLAREVVAPFMEPRADPRLPELLASVDLAVSAHLRSVLRDPAFRAVEAAWLGLQSLVRDLETGSNLKVQLLDASADELRSLAGTGQVPPLGEGGEGAAPDLVVFLHRFGATVGEADLLAALLGRICSTGGMLVADGSPRVNGSGEERVDADPDVWVDRRAAEDQRRWTELALHEGAAHGALVVNRLAVRMPYGPRGTVIDSFEFDELEAGTRSDCPWGYGALAVAHLYGRLAAELEAAPHDLNARAVLERQPVILVEEAGEVVQIPSVEVELGDRAVTMLRESGLAVLRSERGADHVTVGPVVALDCGVLRRT
ncbi:MAG: type VI secretion system contractile sheath large subunit [Planctomycetota bacterium]|nr:type VI secretion system contractile sheath large subunit [Planctomycetota bacterium]